MRSKPLPFFVTPCIYSNTPQPPATDTTFCIFRQARTVWPLDFHIEGTVVSLRLSSTTTTMLIFPVEPCERLLEVLMERVDLDEGIAGRL